MNCTTAVVTLGGDKFKNGASTGSFAYAFGSIGQRNAAANDLSTPRYDNSDPNYHYYDVEGTICTRDSVCTIDSVKLANRLHPAPGTFSNTTPVVDAQISNAQLGYSGSADDFGPVVHSVSADGLTVTNTTLPGHRLHPGYVRRSVVVRGDTISIRTIGEGIGPMGDLNTRFAGPLWNGLVNSHVRYRINLGYRP